MAGPGVVDQHRGEGEDRRRWSGSVRAALLGTGRWSWLGWVAGALLFGTTLTFVVAAFRASFGFDESYNLQVVLNLVHGHGYATQGTWYGDGTHREAFDPAITTGPTLLLPVSAVVAVLGEHAWVYRLVPVTFFLLLLVAWGRVGADVAGRAGMFAAPAGVLIVNTCAATAPGSPLLGAGDVLGEVAATALLVLSARSLRLPGWSGLLFGLALMSKMLVLLAGPVLLAGVLLTPGASGTRRSGAVAWCAAASTPVVAWQAVRLVALGPQLARTRDVQFWHIFQTRGSGLEADGSLNSWQRAIVQIPMLGLVGVVVILAALGVICWYGRRMHRRLWRRLHPVLVLLVGGLCMEGWWCFLAGFDNPRHTVILTYLLVPGVLLTATAMVRELWEDRAITLTGMVLAAPIAIAVVVSALTPRIPVGGTLAEQLVAARYLRSQHVPAYSIVSYDVPGLALVSGVPEQRLDGSGGLLVLSDWARLNSPSTWMADRARCTQVLRHADGYLFCRAAPMAGSAAKQR